MVRSNAWRTREKIFHVDKLKLKTRAEAATDGSDRLQPDPTPIRSDDPSDQFQHDPTSDCPGRGARSERAA